MAVEKRVRLERTGIGGDGRTVHREVIDIVTTRILRPIHHRGVCHVRPTYLFVPREPTPGITIEDFRAKTIICR